MTTVSEPAFCEPVFEEPWQAQAFALANALIDKGFFSAEEWAQALGAEIRRAQAAGDPDTGETYYNHWLAALERLCADKGLALGAEVARRAEEWRDAYLATPHGKPVSLRNR
ncbi:MAG: nitrile hydratase accessory protein [Rhodospirillales bacterium CG15_BIG_FIL_POST_REV_8_21_14_020_66_15]|nr:MAG: nitrile hydratase accessory protein [Rhodospirillales bacterium CG15_BIG_FIL_POST_REV_8_21_14_020_66_15]